MPRIHNFFVPYIDYLDGFEHNITFLRGNFNILTKLNCDWCSIFNGCLHTIHNNISKCKKPKLNANNIHVVIEYFEKALKNRKEKVSHDAVVLFCKTNYKYYNSNKEFLETFARIYLMIESIETRWCPFKSAQNYYRNSDNRYVYGNLEDAYIIGKILSTDETINCINCVKEVNKYFESVYTEDLFKNFVDYLQKYCLMQKLL